MAQVTIELRTLLKVHSFKLFDFEYPILSEEWKSGFEELFIQHYYGYEIGQETPDMFKQRLKSKLNMIMPRYKSRFDKMKLLLNPLQVEQTIKDSQRDQLREVDSISNTDVDVQSQTISSDYPQYASNTNNIPSVQTEDSTGSDGSQSEERTDHFTDTHHESITKIGGVAELSELLSIQDNLTEQIIEECKTLFILVY